MKHEDAVLISAYTGFLLTKDFADVHKFCEHLLQRPIESHEFAFESLQNEITKKCQPLIRDTTLRMNWDELTLLSAYTGYMLMPDFSYIRNFCCKILGHDVTRDDFSSELFVRDLRQKLKPYINYMIQNEEKESINNKIQSASSRSDKSIPSAKETPEPQL